MKKYLAILLAALMLFMAGCGITVENGETTAETTEPAPVLLTAEDYFLKAFEADLARTMEMSEAYKSAHMSLGVANVDYLLSLFAMNNIGLPEISDVVLEIAANGESLNAAYILSAAINGHDANIGLNIDMTDFDMAVYSNLFEDVIGINYSEMVGMELPDMSNLYEFYYNATEKYVMLIGELLMEHNTGVELTDNGDTVTVGFGLDGEKIFDLVKALVDEIAADEQFVKFLSDFYQIDFVEDVKVPFEESAADAKEEIVSSGVKMSMGVEIDKTTFYAYHVDVEITDGDETVVISGDQMEGAASATVTVGEEAVVSFGYLTAPDTFSLDFALESADVNCGGHLLAEGGTVDFAANATVSEYDWDAGKEVLVEHNITADGTYTADDTSFVFTLGKIAYNDIEIDLAKAGITLGYAINADVPTAPEVTKNFLDITDEEGQALIMSIFEKLEINPAMFGVGAAEPETEMDYEVYYEESVEVQ